MLRISNTGPGEKEQRHMSGNDIELNGVTYRWPSRSVVVVCIDGGDPEYIDRGIEDGIIPNIETFMKNGFYSVYKHI